jgi:hypothetical protein
MIELNKNIDSFEGYNSIKKKNKCLKMKMKKNTSLINKTKHNFIAHFFFVIQSFHWILFSIHTYIHTHTHSLSLSLSHFLFLVFDC